MKMFLIGLAVAAVAFLAWNSIPGFRYAAPNHWQSADDIWTMPVNPRIPMMLCEDDAHPGTSWRVHGDGLCHAEDAPGAAPRSAAAPSSLQPAPRIRPPFSAVPINQMYWCSERGYSGVRYWRPYADLMCYEEDATKPLLPGDAANERTFPH
jgi:hypothetical protein